MKTLPDVTGIEPQMMFSILVFPLPLLPTTETNEPVSIVREKLSNRQVSVTVPGL